MAVQNKTIASSGGDYTSLSLGEAAIGSSNADTWTFTYVEALADTTRCAFSAASFTGTIDVTVSAAYRCKGARTGSHASLVNGTVDGNASIQVLMTSVRIAHLRIGKTGTGTGQAIEFGVYGAAPNCSLKNCTVFKSGGGAGAVLLVADAPNIVVSGNYFIQDGKTSGPIVDLHHQPAATVAMKFYRNKVFQSDGTATSYVQVRGTTSHTVDAQQNVCLYASGATQTNGYYLGANGAWAAGSDHNVSGLAANAPGTNGTNSVLAADVYTTLTVGSENLDYVSYAAMSAFGTGNDLSADVGSTDIKGNTIAEWYPGADYVAAPIAASTGRRGLRFKFGFR
jgi:hypothetical protein